MLSEAVPYETTNFYYFAPAWMSNVVMQIYHKVNYILLFAYVKIENCIS